MPKKYRVEMTLLVDATNVVVDTDEHTENCEDDTQRQSSSSRGRLKRLETPPRDRVRRV